MPPSACNILKRSLRTSPRMPAHMAQIRHASAHSLSTPCVLLRSSARRTRRRPRRRARRRARRRPRRRPPRRAPRRSPRRAPPRGLRALRSSGLGYARAVRIHAHATCTHMHACMHAKRGGPSKKTVQHSRDCRPTLLQSHVAPCTHRRSPISSRRSSPCRSSAAARALSSAPSTTCEL